MNRRAYSHFCDDVRAEVGNKFSLMGIYGGELFVQGAPTVLPKLVIAMFFSTPPDEPFNKLKFVVRAGDQTMVEHEMPPQEIEKIVSGLKRLPDANDPITGLTIGVTLFVSPFIVDKPMTIKATAICDGEELPAGRLYVKLLDAVNVIA